MLLIVALAGLAGAVVFCALFIIMGLKGNSVKLPAIGLGACGLVVGVVAVLVVLGIGVPDGETADGGGIDVGKGLFNVTLTIPADYLDEGVTQEQLDKEAEEKEYKSAKLNDDGSVTYVISKSQHKKMMEEIRKSIDEGLAEMAESEDAPNIVRIEANDDYSQYKVVISSDEVGLTESFAALALYFNSGMYHVFNGTQIDNVNIQYVNDKTGEVIQEANSQDLGGSDDEPNSDEPVFPGEEKNGEYALNESWVVDGQWSLTITGVTETQERNEFSDKTPGAVYIVDYTYTNFGYEESYSDGLFFSIDDTIVDSGGKMGTTYPGNYTKYAQETPIGATCDAQTCIGVENPGDFTLTVTKYDGNDIRQSAVFVVTVE